MSDLDDFFAKKDKKDKTKRNKKKGLSNDDLEKKFDVKPSERSRERKFPSNLECFLKEDEGEWNDFADEESKDYSGLKIQTLSIKDKEEEQREEEELTKSKEQAGQTPWKQEQEGKKESEVETKEDSGDLIINILRNRSKPLPRINDAAEFPNLGVQQSEANETTELKGFQPVHGVSSGVNRLANASQNSGETVSTDNKYSALMRKIMNDNENDK